jgi:hypothetical protein
MQVDFLTAFPSAADLQGLATENFIFFTEQYQFFTSVKIFALNICWCWHME